MFKFKKKEEFKGQIHFIDKCNNVIQKEPFTNLPFRNDLITALSIKKFNDNDPCIIHQTYCRNFIGLELVKEINEGHKELINKEIHTSNTPEVLNNKLDPVEYAKILDKYEVEYIKIV